LMNVTTQIDAICLERSTMYERGQDKPVLTPDKYITGYSQYVARSEKRGDTYFTEMTIYKDRIQGRALWFDHRYSERLFCSDEMMARMRDIGIEGYRNNYTFKYINEI
jgi:hypothetical protein